MVGRRDLGPSAGPRSAALRRCRRRRLDDRVHRLDHRAGPSACGRGPKKGQSWPGEAVGRSRGGPTTKIHLACDGQGRPLAFTLTVGNINDCTQFEAVMARLRIQRCGPGRLRTRPALVVADKGYSSTKIRAYLRGRGIKAAIPERIDQINGRIRRGESRCRLNRAAYRRRNLAERCFNQLKHHKALATRYDKHARHYQAMVTLACLKLWLP
ncbi:transposase [Streptomyces sp. NRRL F-5755]|nr:transposase [Streptomyces sp. NRRL F-5755]